MANIGDEPLISDYVAFCVPYRMVDAPFGSAQSYNTLSRNDTKGKEAGLIFSAGFFFLSMTGSYLDHTLETFTITTTFKLSWEY